MNHTFFKRIQALVFFLFFIPVIDIQAQSIVFSEAVSSNASYLDEDGDSPDWFELHNSSATPINLDGYSITDNIQNPTKWVFPAIDMAANGYLQVWASGKDRLAQWYPRTVARQGDTVRYIVPNSELPADWKNIGFDDAGWQTGITGIGYSDNDDATTIPPGTLSIFMRQSFVLANSAPIKYLVLDIDYDDSFVAYVNGVEIARANLYGSPPAFDATAYAGHEALLYQGGIPERFVFAVPPGMLSDGENILAIQGHNVSNSSSDMTLIPYLSVFADMAITDGVQPPELLNLGPVYLHSNFKISSAGETLYLFDTLATLVDSLLVPATPQGTSFGLYNSPNEYRYFQTPTPGAANAGVSYLGKVNSEVIFSVEGGSISPQDISLTGDAAGEEIRYTLDATEPTETSTIYVNPIPVNNTTVVRAAIFKAGYLPAESISKTYVINDRKSIPIIHLVTDPVNLFDDNYGIYALGPNAQANVPFFGANFWEDWERPVHFSLYEADGTLGISMNAGIKIYGAWSRANPQKSMAIYARGEYGTGAIDYPIFPVNPYASYQAIVLRNSGNDWLNTNFRDAALTSLLRGEDIEYQEYRAAAAYINGEYWGIYNMREKINEHFLASKAGISADSINILEFNGDVIHGSNQAYLEMLNFLGSNSLADSANYAFIKSKIDIDNYILYLATEIYINNRDWPGNNIKFWNHPDGKWRWILFDTDFGFGPWNKYDYEANTLQFALDGSQTQWPNPAWSTFLFRKMVVNTEFRNQFINKFADLLNTRFAAPKVNAHIDSLATIVASEMSAHYVRWGSDYNSWYNNVNNMKFFGSYRVPEVRKHIMSQFGLTKTRLVRITIPLIEQGTAKINSVTINKTQWNGYYFEGVPITIKAIPAPGYQFAYWTGSIESNEAELVLDPSSDILLTPHFVPGEITGLPPVINEINYNSSTNRDTKDWVEIYNPNTATIDLSGWEIKDNNDLHSYVIPDGTHITGRGFLVITRDLNAFRTFYPDLDNISGDFTFGFSSSGDAVRLFDPTGTLVDRVIFSPTTPWPTEANGTGPTLELLDPFYDNELPENWATLHPFGSPGQPNVVITGIEDEQAKVTAGLSIYPNPVRDIVNIAFELKEQDNVLIQIRNLEGRNVATVFKGTLSRGTHALAYSLQSVPGGIYLVEMVEGSGQLATRRIIKARNN